jgi:Fe-S cluster assembly ATPase SufC
MLAYQLKVSGLLSQHAGYLSSSTRMGHNMGHKERERLKNKVLQCIIAQRQTSQRNLNKTNSGGEVKYTHVKRAHHMCVCANIPCSLHPSLGL